MAGSEALDERSRAEHLEREFETFASAVSHDLRGPLGLMASITDLLRREHAAGLSRAGRELLDSLADATGVLERCLEGLVGVARLATRRPEVAPLDAARLFETAAGAVRSARPEWPGTIRIEGVPPLRGDAGMLERAAVRLLENAVRFSEGRGAAACVVVRGEEGPEPGWVTVHVEDNGVGYDVDEAAGLFRPFRRLHAADDDAGPGVGLAEVRAIVEGHGGRVWAEGRPGEGAVFSFALPGGATAAGDGTPAGGRDSA